MNVKVLEYAFVCQPPVDVRRVCLLTVRRLGTREGCTGCPQMWQLVAVERL